MKTEKSIFFEVVVNTETTDKNGCKKMVNETYATKALCFTDAESNTLCFFNGKDIQVKKVAIAPYMELFLPENTIGELRYYRVVVKTFTLDERTGKEKKSKVYHLVEATDIDSARALVKEAYKVAYEYEIASIVETKILEII